MAHQSAEKSAAQPKLNEKQPEPAYHPSISSGFPVSVFIEAFP